VALLSLAKPAAIIEADVRFAGVFSTDDALLFAERGSYDKTEQEGNCVGQQR
jgi:hypothetical protein